MYVNYGGSLSRPQIFTFISHHGTWNHHTLYKDRATYICNLIIGSLLCFHLGQFPLILPLGDVVYKLYCVKITWKYVYSSENGQFVFHRLVWAFLFRFVVCSRD